MERGSLTATECGELDELLEHAQSGNHYALLGVATEDQSGAIQEAYYTLSRQWHPDRHFRRDLGDYAEHLDFIFIQITKAYKTLSNPDARRKHDREARNSSRAPTQAKRAAEPAMDAPAPSPQDPKETAKAKARQKKRTDQRGRGLTSIRKQMRSQAGRARRYFDQGKADYEAGHVGKAVSSLHLACQFDPRKKEYQALYESVRDEARSLQAEQFIQAGASAEQL